MSGTCLNLIRYLEKYAFDGILKVIGIKDIFHWNKPLYKLYCVCLMFIYGKYTINYH